MSRQVAVEVGQRRGDRAGENRGVRGGRWGGTMWKEGKGGAALIELVFFAAAARGRG